MHVPAKTNFDKRKDPLTTIYQNEHAKAGNEQ